jgi:S-adenosylmethionine:tRNA ribosyltransferase-isomerase
MKLEDFNYSLAPALIAQKPARPRDHARFLVVRKKTMKFEERIFSDITDYLQAGDLLVLNDSKVIPARLIGKKASGGKVEVLLSRALSKTNWEAIGQYFPKPGEKIFFSKTFFASVKKINHGEAELEFNCSGQIFWKRLSRFGKIPLPPYIASSGKKLDTERYQTVYAAESKNGSVAAPTAGLHFTPRLLTELKKRKINIAKITLHVGLGTFQPIHADDISKHTMHAEYIEVSAQVLQLIKKTKQHKKKVIAVGTTSLRALEAAIRERNALQKGFSGETNIFIYPPFTFRAVDALITNFHLPKSTLLLLVSAFAGTKTIKEAYQYAVDHNFRFYSYGDAMLLI